MCQNVSTGACLIWNDEEVARSREWNRKGNKLVSDYEGTYKLFEKARAVYKTQLKCNVEIPVQS